MSRNSFCAHKPSRRDRLCLAIALSLVSGLTASHVAGDQPRRPTERPRDTMTAQQELAQVQRVSSDLLARTVLRRSRNLARPTTEDYRLAALGLHLARRMSPQDAELLRHEIEAWTAADDVPRLMEATRELVRMDPRDTIAQLRLIDTQIGRLNTVEERRAAYDRLLGNAGQSLRPSVRSRLALDAALLAREDGDERAFLKLLTDATLLDATNKNAAALYASVLLQFADTPIERFELIANVLLADPLDAGLYENAAVELMSNGAHAGAARMLERMRDLLTASGQDFMSRAFLTEPSLYRETLVNDYLIVTWQTQGADRVLSFIADAQGHAETRFTSEVRQMRERGFSEAQMQQMFGERTFPFLPYQLELLRLLALVGQPPEQAEKMAFRERPIRRDEFYSEPNTFGLSGYISPPPVTDAQIAELESEYPDANPTLLRQFAEQRAREQREVNPIHEAATRYLLATAQARRSVQGNERIDDRTKRLFDVNIALEAIWMLLVSELSVDLAEQRLMSLVELFGEDNLESSALDRYRGWIACNRGDFDTARQLLAPLIDTDASALYALAMTELNSGQTVEAVRLFDRLRLRFPQTALACVAADRMQTLTGQRPGPTRFARELDDYARNFAPWMERMTRSPREFMSVTVTLTAPTLGPLDRMEANLRLTNLSGRPLSVGPESPINSRFLFTPRIDVEGTEYARLVRELLLSEARRQLDLPAGAALPSGLAEQVEDAVQRQVLVATRRLLEVVDADRVLRLEPNESLVIPVWLGRGNAGELIDRNLTERVAVQWSVAQGFVQGRRPGAEQLQGFVTGPMSINTRTDQQVRIKLGDLSDTVLAERLENSDGAELARTILHATSLLSRPVGANPADSLVTRQQRAVRMKDILVSRMPSLGDEHLTLLLLRMAELGVFVSDQELRRTMSREVNRRLTEPDARREASKVFLLAAAITAVSSTADHPLIRLATESGDRELSEFASVLAGILERSGMIGGDAEEALDQQLEPENEPVFEIDESFLAPPKSDG